MGLSGTLHQTLVVVIDEISTVQEGEEQPRRFSQRGIALIATAHGTPSFVFYSLGLGLGKVHREKGSVNVQRRNLKVYSENGQKNG